MTVRRLAVLGTGLMGASVGLAAKRAGVERIAGFDVDGEALAAALATGAVDVAAETLGAAVADADLVVVATPTRTVSEIVAAVSGVVAAQCTITDVGSTKSRICSELAGVHHFVGGHPLCGSEASGPESAHADLFDGATWFLARSAEPNALHHERVAAFTRDLGASPLAIDPGAHDRLVAVVSHLPHALANLLVAQVGAAEIEGLDPLAVAGVSFRDLTRVAGTNSSVWADIFLDNRERLAAALAELRGRSEELEAALRAGDADAILHSIEEASAHRARLNATGESGP